MIPTAPHWELFSHDADIGIRGIGDSLNQAFEMAAVALTAVVADPARIPASLVFSVDLKEENNEFLFFEWINYLIYTMDTEKVLFSQFSVAIADTDHRLIAQVHGEKIEKMKSAHADFSVEIKGATFTELKVIQKNLQWIAQCVVDI